MALQLFLTEAGLLKRAFNQAASVGFGYLVFLIGGRWSDS